MDTLTHSFCGWIIGRAGAGRLGAWATPALVVAANLPDIDAVASPAIFSGVDSFEQALRVNHHGITHSLLGGALESALLALLIWSAGWCMRHRWHDRPPLWAAFAVAAAGVYAHIFLDWLTTYGVRLWLPFNSSWSYGDAAFIVDPWIWLILGGALFLGTGAGAISRALWLFFGLTTSLLLFVAGRQHVVPWTAAALWPSLLVTLVALRALIFRYRPAELSARLGLWVFTVYLAALLFCSHVATHDALVHLKQEHGVLRRGMVTSANPVPAVPWRYEFLAQMPDGTIECLGVDVLRRTVTPKGAFNANLRDPALAPFKDSEQFRAWLSFARHPVCIHEPNRLILGDMRYRLLGRRDWTELALPLPAGAH